MLKDKEIQREKLILNMAVDGFWDWDLKADQFYLSPSFCERLGYSSATLFFDTHFIKKIVYPDDHQKIFSFINEIVHKKKETSIIACRIIATDGSVHWFESRCAIVAYNEDGIASRIVGTIIDISSQKQMESELQRLNRALLAISNCNQVMLHANSELELLQDICSTVIEIGGYRMAWVGYAKDDREKSIHLVAKAGFDDGYLQKLKISWADNELGQGPGGTAIRTGRPFLTQKMLTDQRFKPWRVAALSGNYVASLALPLKTDGKVFGVLNIYSDMADAFNPKEIDLLTALAANLAYGITMLRTRNAHEKADNEMQQSEARYRSLFENKHTVMLIIDPEDGRIVDANPAAVIYYGWKRGELRNMQISQINILAEAEAKAEMELARTEKRNFFFFRHRQRDGSVRDVKVVSGPISFQEKLLLYSIVTDITDRKQAEEELYLSEERFRKLFQSHALVNILLDPDTGNIVDANPSAADFYGWSVDELKQMNIRQINPLSVKEIKKNLEKSRLSKQNKFLFCHYRSDGSFRDVEVFSSKIEVAGKELLYATVFDVTERKLAEEALRDSEQKFRTITEQIAEMVFVTDTRGVLTYVSQAVEKIFGYTPQEVTGHSIFEYLVEEEIPRALVILKESLLHRVKDNLLEFRCRKKNGSFFFGEVHVHYHHDRDRDFFGVIGLIRDITERKREEEERQQLESHLRKSQRLETIGTLAGGIAHDFNNILMPILGYAEMGVMSLSKGDPMYQYFSEIMLAAERAQQLVSQILTFSKVPESDSAVVSVQAVICEALNLIRPLIPATITIEQHFESCCNILADSSKLHQVILNLCTNAFHAMELSGGVLKIELREIIPDSCMLKLFPNLHAERYVQMRISDTGYGMDESILEHVFEPFFTTKSVNKGTGLGLSVVHGIIKSFQGEITVESQPGKGSLFSIYLPVINNITLEAIEEKSCAKGSGSILLVDDEEATLKMMRLMITQLGFEITALNLPEQALKLFLEHPEQFDLVITDQTMAKMTGVELAEKIHEIKPKLPIILMTGYEKNLNDKALLNQFGIRKLLKKPLKMNEIALIINELTAPVLGTE
jgi:two-component system, cell cycle sensor histidine kinase and response regulator CckA